MSAEAMSVRARSLILAVLAILAAHASTSETVSFLDCSPSPSTISFQTNSPSVLGHIRALRSLFRPRCRTRDATHIMMPPDSGHAMVNLKSGSYLCMQLESGAALPINKIREEHGLSALQWDSALQETSQTLVSPCLKIHKQC